MPTVISKDELIASIEQMTVLELSDLVKALEEKFGVSAAALAPVAVAGAVEAAPAAAAAEKTEFNVILATVAADKKIQIIKEVRAITGLGLKEAKAVVDEAPKPLKENVSKEEAENIKKQLEAVGATVEVK